MAQGKIVISANAFSIKIAKGIYLIINFSLDYNIGFHNVLGSQNLSSKVTRGRCLRDRFMCFDGRDHPQIMNQCEDGGILREKEIEVICDIGDIVPLLFFI